MEKLVDSPPPPAIEELNIEKCNLTSLKNCLHKTVHYGVVCPIAVAISAIAVTAILAIALVIGTFAIPTLIAGYFIAQLAHRCHLTKNRRCFSGENIVENCTRSLNILILALLFSIQPAISACRWNNSHQKTVPTR